VADPDQLHTLRCDAEAWLRLTLVPGVSQALQRVLLRALGSPAQVLSSSPSRITQACGKPDVAGLLTGGPDRALLESTLRWLEGDGRHLLTLGDASYPPQLLEIPDPPNVLYAIGRLELLTSPCFAVVGSRNCTPQGGRDARSISQELSDQGLCIVSGLALGIDTNAHCGGLAGGGASIAVMGTGPNLIYPRGNRGLAHRLAREGCLISDFPLGTPSLPRNFPLRNRLISGLSRGVLVMEAAERSGSLVTARLANEQGRDVFAVPGSIHSPHAKGCHRLIKDGAKLVESAQDVLVELGLARATAQEGSRSSALDKRDGRPNVVLNAIGFAPLTVDQIAGLTEKSPGVVAAELSLLEVEGRVDAMPGGRFLKRHATPSAPEMPAPGHVIE